MTERIENLDIPARSDKLKINDNICKINIMIWGLPTATVQFEIRFTAE